MSSIRESILANAATSLEAALISGGYNNDLADRVSRRVKHWDEVTEFPVLFVSGGGEEKSKATAGETEARMELIVRGYEHDAEDPSAKLENLIQDVEKALTADPRRGGYAQWTEPKRIDTDEGWLGPHGVFEFRFEVTYQYADGAP